MIRNDTLVPRNSSGQWETGTREHKMHKTGSCGTHCVVITKQWKTNTPSDNDVSGETRTSLAQVGTQQ